MEYKMQEQEFRSSLDNVCELAELLLPYCKDVQDLIGMAKLALANDGQLKLIMSLVTVQQQQRKQEVRR